MIFNIRIQLFQSEYECEFYLIIFSRRRWWDWFKINTCSLWIIFERFCIFESFSYSGNIPKWNNERKEKVMCETKGNFNCQHFFDPMQRKRLIRWLTSCCFIKLENLDETLKRSQLSLEMMFYLPWVNVIVSLSLRNKIVFIYTHFLWQ